MNELIIAFEIGSSNAISIHPSIHRSHCNANEIRIRVCFVRMVLVCVVRTHICIVTIFFRSESAAKWERRMCAIEMPKKENNVIEKSILHPCTMHTLNTNIPHTSYMPSSGMEKLIRIPNCGLWHGTYRTSDCR